jgi:hypothetical protein
MLGSSRMASYKGSVWTPGLPNITETPCSFKHATTASAPVSTATWPSHSFTGIMRSDHRGMTSMILRNGAFLGAERGGAVAPQV